MQPNEPVDLDARLTRIEEMIARLVDRETAKDWYTPAEFARLVGRSDFTVREWCRLGRVRAEKRAGGRGRHRDWVVADAEVRRYRRDGLLPVGRPAGGANSGV